MILLKLQCGHSDIHIHQAGFLMTFNEIDTISWFDGFEYIKGIDSIKK